MKKIYIGFALLMVGCSIFSSINKYTEKYTRSTYFDDLNNRLTYAKDSLKAINSVLDTIDVSLSEDSIKQMDKEKAKSFLNKKEDELKIIKKRTTYVSEECYNLSKDYTKRIKEAPNAQEFQGVRGKAKLLGAIEDANESLKKTKELINEVKITQNKIVTIASSINKLKNMLKK